MKKDISKTGFMEHLSFLLSFHFKAEETASILNDYEDWFASEAALGKSEAEICAVLESPHTIVKNLCLESKETLAWYSVFFHNTMLQLLALTILQILVGIPSLEYCSRNAVSFLKFALFLNLLYFAAGAILISKPCNTRSCNNKGNLPVLGLAMSVLLMEVFAVSKLDSPNSGRICVWILGILTFILVVAGVLFAVLKSRQDKLCAFITVFHMAGTITMFWFAVSRFHLLYQDMSGFISGSIIIYLETIVLCLLLYFIKRSSAGKE